FRGLGEGAMYGAGGQKRVPDDFVRDFRLALPPPPEQNAIAAFLDRETGKIDALMEEQKRLIELLKEKRQAVISHAVTKGLEPDAPMKHSGVEWLGDVPEHWTIKPLKHMVSHVVDCLHTTPTYDGELLYPAIRTADVERGVLLLQQAKLVSEDVYRERIQRLKPEEGDVLYSREGERFGMAALVPSGVNLCLGQRMMMFRVQPSGAPGFLMWALNSEPIYQEVLARTAGATAPHANISDLINFRVPCPPDAEQQAIARWLDRATGQIDRLSEKANGAILLLQERRSALISAAVTGKIDVRQRAEVETAA
ncbi:restriction endonuclease subunit S, partial [Mesorhizobium sp. M0676]|uniref:restriction endonuclease subunit S n=1 Tax=Mesorhizobium sp. M0676 TaxID=2956984 RepID=UPI003335F199